MNYSVRNLQSIDFVALILRILNPEKELEMSNSYVWELVEIQLNETKEYMIK